jgi:thioredoxin 1
MSLIHVTKDNFAEVKASEKPVLLDFFATWCGPCRMIAPLIEQIAEEHPEFVVAKIDVDEEPELAQAFGIQSIPTLVVLKNGEVAETAVGARPKDAIVAMLSR